MKPMKAADLAKVGNDVTQLRYPLAVSAKLDGYRTLLDKGVALSNNLEPHANRFIQTWARQACYHGQDGELIVGEPTGGNVLGRTASGVKTLEGEPDFTLWLFDNWTDPKVPFWTRHRGLVVPRREKRIQILPHEIVKNPDALLRFEEKVLADGYEGVMWRALDGPYKFGRSTLKEGWLGKLKRFADGEAVVMSLEAAMANNNVATVNKLGLAKRGSSKAGKVEKPMVGAIIVKDPKWGELRLQPGVMSHDDRIHYWAFPQELIGALVHWRSFGYGIKDKPRFARYYGLR